MKEISVFIDQKKDEFSRLPFFDYLRNRSIDPMTRLAFAPYAAPFVMSFGELNKAVFRHEPTSDPIQAIINKHTYEDDHHWLWFLEDLDKLGFNPSKSFKQTLKFLWSEQTQAARKLSYEIYHCTVNAQPIRKFVVIEVIEATGNVLFDICSNIIQEMQAHAKKQDYRFFGASHLAVETGHAYEAVQDRNIIENFPLTESEKKESFELVTYVFSVFTEFVGELLTNTQRYQVKQSVTAINPQPTQLSKPIGSYLLEAGLVNAAQLQDALNQQQLTYMPIGQILSSQGYVNQNTIEYLIEKVVMPERKLPVVY